jgi:hypothetical protein
VQAVADTFVIGDVSVRRLGFGAMRRTGPGTWGEPGDRSEAKRVKQLEENLGANDLHLISNELDALDSYRLAGVHTLRRQLRRWARPLAVPIATRILLLRFPRR